VYKRQVLSLVHHLYPGEKGFRDAWINDYLSYFEVDRANAGKWVAENTPEDFVVLSYWGAPQYYSKRKTIDGSALNRKYEQVDNVRVDLIEKYKPEILVLGAIHGQDTAKFDDRDGSYQVMAVFDETYKIGRDHAWGVLVRADVVDQIGPQMVIPRNLMSNISNQVKGDEVGNISNFGEHTLFIHPGNSTPTTFDFSIAGKVVTPRYINIMGRMHQDIPKEGAENGGGIVRLIIKSGDDVLINQLISPNHNLEDKLYYHVNDILQVEVSNEGSADYDWFLLKIE
jgi:hypothetical protein